MKYEKAAETFCAAIKTLAEKHDNLCNLESYLTHNFGEWLSKFANTPETLALELKEFAEMEI